MTQIFERGGRELSNDPQLQWTILARDAFPEQRPQVARPIQGVFA
jgi:hypothetical protein